MGRARKASGLLPTSSLCATYAIQQLRAGGNIIELWLRDRAAILLRHRDPFADDHLGIGDGLTQRSAIGHATRQFRHLSDPCAIRFAPRQNDAVCPKQIAYLLDYYGLPLLCHMVHCEKTFNHPLIKELTMDEHLLPAPISPFEQIKHSDDAGEYWSARELSALLDYSDWRNFEKAIKRAMTACKTSGQQVSDHFVGSTDMILLGKGGQRSLKDYHLSRYACYLVVENADPDKEKVALGQTYFAIRTRRDEIAQNERDKRNQELEELHRRIVEREKLKKYHKSMYKVAQIAGVTSPQDFAIFEDHGYLGLYHEKAEQIIERKGLKPSANPSDYMGVVELAANGFRAALTSEMLVVEDAQGKDVANATHYRAGGIVRRAMEEAGVPTPEKLPTPIQSIQQAKRELARQQQIEVEDRLGLWVQIQAGEAEQEE